MKPRISGRWAATLCCALLEWTAPGLQGQASDANQRNPPPPASAGQEAAEQSSTKPGRLAIGFRVRSLPIRPFSVMGNKQTMTTTYPSPAHDWSFNTTSQSSPFGVGPAFELRTGRKTVLTGELLFQRLRYDKVLDVYWNTNDPTTSADERSHMTATENTKARLWDVPVMWHYEGIRSSGLLSRMYVAGGPTFRAVSTIRTTNNITYADATTANNTIPAQASKRSLFGAVVGIGFRFIDDFHVKTTPEIRYTRWAGATFGSDSTQSPRNQLEVGIAFTR